MLSLTENEWRDIRRKIKEEYHWKPSILLIREVMRRELGFTIRYHSEYKEQSGYIETIVVDFYDDARETWFRLKYL